MTALLALWLIAFCVGVSIKHSAQWREPGYLRCRPLDLVERRDGRVGHNSRGQRGFAMGDPSNEVVIFVLSRCNIAYLKTDFGPG